MKLVKHSRTGMDMFPSFADRFFNDAFGPLMSAEVAKEYRPYTDVIKNEKGYLIKVALPGIKKEYVKIEVHDSTLSITAEHRHNYSEEKDQILRSEITYGTFTRHFTLGNEVDSTKISAEFKDGLLVLELPFSEKSAPRAIALK